MDKNLASVIWYPSLILRHFAWSENKTEFDCDVSVQCKLMLMKPEGVLCMIDDIIILVMGRSRALVIAHQIS